MQTSKTSSQSAKTSSQVSVSRDFTPGTAKEATDFLDAYFAGDEEVMARRNPHEDAENSMLYLMGKGIIYKPKVSAAKDHKELTTKYGAVSYGSRDELIKSDLVNLLARIIYGEQTQIKNSGQEAVAWLMVNRVLVQNKGEFSYGDLPSSLYSIATRPQAFTCIDKEGGNNNSFTTKTENDTGWANAVKLACELVNAFDNNYTIGKVLTSAEKDSIRQIITSSMGDSPIGKGCWYVASYQWKGNYKVINGIPYYKGHEIYPEFKEFNGNIFYNYRYADI